MPYKSPNKNPLVSIIINNYNYGRFLSEAIESAINQTYTNTEVVVVDDGSTDGSPEIIRKYDEKIIAVLKENGGQASAFNSGFEACHGSIIIFLDSDDVLLPSAVAIVTELFINEHISKVHWPLYEVNEYGQKNGRVFPSASLQEGNLLDEVIKYGPGGHISSPTSGNAWSRKFLEEVLPMPTEAFKISADGYLFMLAPLFGLIGVIKDPIGFYRIHGKNNFKGSMLKEETLKLKVSQYDQSCILLKKFFNRLGIYAETQHWTDKSWFYGLYKSINEIKRLVPENETFILVDEDQWEAAGKIAGRKIIPFLENNGQYWGPPTDDATAIREIECQRQRGAVAMVFAWTAFWWLDYYSGMHDYLKCNYKCTLSSEHLRVFSLKQNIH